MPDNELLDAVREALAGVVDPEIKRPITELGMVESLSIDDDDVVSLTVLLTIPGCPMKSTIEHDVTAAVTGVSGVGGINLTLGAMNAYFAGAAKPGQIVTALGKDKPDVIFAGRHAGTQTGLLGSEAFRALTGRSPDETETKILTQLFAEQKNLFANDSAGATKPKKPMARLNTADVWPLLQPYGCF